MKQYRSFSTVVLILAGAMLVFALVVFGLARGDVTAIVEFFIPRGRRAPVPHRLAYPAWVVMASAVGYAAATAIAGLAYRRGSTAILVVSCVVGVAAAIGSWYLGTTFAGTDRSAWTAGFVALLALALVLWSTISMFFDRRKNRPVRIDGV